MTSGIEDTPDQWVVWLQLCQKIKFKFNCFELKLKRKMQLAKQCPNRTTISVTEMVVCNREWWVNRNKKII